jgi:hypothetical protein
MYKDSQEVFGFGIDRDQLFWLAERFGYDMWETQLTDLFIADVFHWWTQQFKVKQFIIWDNVAMFKTNLSVATRSRIVSEMATRTILRPASGLSRHIPGNPLPQPWDRLLNKEYILGDFEIPSYRAGRKRPPLKYYLRKLFGN